MDPEGERGFSSSISHLPSTFADVKSFLVDQSLVLRSSQPHCVTQFCIFFLPDFSFAPFRRAKGICREVGWARG